MLGPLVVGGFCCSADELPNLIGLGVRDSKLLSPAQRDAVYGRLAAVGKRWSIAIPPRTIDRYVGRGGLNELELETFARLVIQLRPDVAYVDACDTNAARFGQRLAAIAGSGTRVVSRHKADRDFPVVGAASIVAKVRRDGALARLRAAAVETLGSGYPSDAETRSCVERHARDGGQIPSWMRASWATVQRVKRARPARTLEIYVP
ncbi:MAG: ribonuclease HII [Thermoplasmata archaeon]|nr:ribonuclease HII [Thermoplasmata archaeon]